MIPIILDPEVAAFIGAPLGNLGDTNPETERPFICQNGVRPGDRKLAQFRRALELRGTPKLYAQDGRGDDAMVYVKLFDPCGSWSWFITEYSPVAPDGCENLAFGLVAGFENEIGYIDLKDLSSITGRMGIGIEIDCWFQPAPLREIKETLNRKEQEAQHD